MITELRLYYESIEQAYHYVYPILQEALKSQNTSIEIKLVKIRKEFSLYSQRLASIFFWKEPDILLSVIQEGEEFPLILMEFSTAVFTEDHELQRFDGMLAAAKNNCIYVKISPTTKMSLYKHGGNTTFDYTEPFRLIYSKYGKPYFHFEWECDKKGIVKTDSMYLSCPRSIFEFEILLKTVIKQIVEKGYSQKWISEVCDLLQGYSYFSKWLSELARTPQINLSTLNTSRTRYIEKEALLNSAALEVKLNRFGHAMDPERGMLAYYGTLTPNIISKMVFSNVTDAWYKGTPKEVEIRQHVKRKLKSVYDFLYCFALGTGLYSNEKFMNIIAKYENYSKDDAIIDLTQFIHDNFFYLSKPLKTIFSYSRFFTIEDDNNQRKIVFKWSTYEGPQFFTNYPKITPIAERATFDEDDVTYIVVHNILKPNGYKIVAVSYPGAQGDRRILIQPGSGRRQPREYIDIISFLPTKATNLTENKGAYISKLIKECIDTLSHYKSDPAHIHGLEDFKRNFAPEAVNTPTKIGVGFWANKDITAFQIQKLDLKELDYFVYITSDRKQWKIWRTGDENIFKIYSGKVNIPQTYSIIEKEYKNFLLNNWAK